MNRLVLIGNGFDLAHGLNTSYKHFLNWYMGELGGHLLGGLGKEESDGLCSIKLKEDINVPNWASVFQGWYFKRENPFIQWDKHDAFFEAYKDKNLCKFTFISPLLQQIWKQLLSGWVDIENAYYSLLIEVKMSIDKGFIHPDYKTLNKHLDILKSQLIQYLKFESEKKIPVIKEIKEKIFCPIKERELSVVYKTSVDKSILKGKRPSSIMLLNFNYTKTPEQYVSNSSKVKINYIHGQLDYPESVIFGYGDELDSSYQKLKNLNNNECLRHIKSIRYLESDNYRRMLEFIESAPFQIIIMGHSCGNSDRTLLNRLFEHRNCVSIKPYYYINNEEKDNYIDMVQNISRNFTDMNLMRDRVVNKKYCTPLSEDIKNKT